MLFSGRIAGVSGIFGGLLQPAPGDVRWRVALVFGIVVGGILMTALRPDLFGLGVQRPLAVIVAAGLLVGFGARLGSGCTSGHGVCGVARFSPRSIVATTTFVATGAGGVLLARHVLGGGT
jgi:uncharacterized membrane protein YedE/YeeE